MFSLNHTHHLPHVCIIAEKAKRMFSQKKMQDYHKDHLHCYRCLNILLGSGAILLVALALLLSGDIRLAVLNALISYVLCKFLDALQHLHGKGAHDH